MGRKSSIARLPPEVKSFIEGQLADGRLTLDEMIAELRERFPQEASNGALPSRSALHRYGPKLERRLIGLKAFTDSGLALKTHAKDDEDLRSGALMAIVQQDLFEAMMRLSDASDPDVDPAERIMLLKEAAKGIASLTNSSVTLKKHQARAEAELEAKMRAKVLAEQSAQLDALQAKGGVTELTRQEIRRTLGIQ